MPLESRKPDVGAPGSQNNPQTKQIDTMKIEVLPPVHKPDYFNAIFIIAPPVRLEQANRRLRHIQRRLLAMLDSKSPPLLLGGSDVSPAR